MSHFLRKMRSLTYYRDSLVRNIILESKEITGLDEFNRRFESKYGKNWFKCKTGNKIDYMEYIIEWCNGLFDETNDQIYKSFEKKTLNVYTKYWNITNHELQALGWKYDAYKCKYTIEDQVEDRIYQELEYGIDLQR